MNCPKKRMFPIAQKKMKYTSKSMIFYRGMSRIEMQDFFTLFMYLK